MNTAHWHLLLNHLPVLGPVFGLGLLALGLWRKSEALKRVSLAVFLLAALLAIPAYLTGEPAEDMVERLPGVSKPIIERHEEAAAAGFTAIVVLGVVALGGLIRYRGSRGVAPWFAVVVLVATVATSGLMAWTANLGGQVRHTEVRSRATVQGHPESHHD